MIKPPTVDVVINFLQTDPKVEKVRLFVWSETALEDWFSAENVRVDPENSTMRISWADGYSKNVELPRDIKLFCKQEQYRWQELATARDALEWAIKAKNIDAHR
jgi:hypothetical protein